MKTAIFLGEGFETCEAMITVDLLRRAKLVIDMVSISNDLEVTSSHGIKIKADYVLQEVDLDAYDAYILPGGLNGTRNLEACTPLKDALMKANQGGKLICAICAAPSILGHLGLLEGKTFTCFPNFEEDGYKGNYDNHVMAVKDGNIITGCGMGGTIEFARTILKELVSDDVLVAVENGIQYEHKRMK